MRDVLAAIGIGPYVLDHVNEWPEPNPFYDIYKNSTCPLESTVIGYYFRQAWGGSAWNNWQGVCKKADGTTCYSVQGPHMSIYSIMNDAATYETPAGTPMPGVPPGQLSDNVHAFNYYAWISTDGDPAIVGHTAITINGVTYIRCPHINSPNDAAINSSK